ncbi:Small-conductance mechanosensitive channel [Arthrobacter sp. ok909]|uniref:mechanosensitive ion channel family protein n=1 Tax=Arthrobacter sp. ok909 TaxID=1761746 RepID=UPI000880F194|nr:mechanosensitive ion channel domain-containing protein [Arthrobacter sp. ok909]SDP58530.1 Small-conductance mechanosensitive channel [Arthrobacter sp. ok909]
MQEFLTQAMPFLAMALAVVAGLVLSWLVRKIVLRLNRSKPELRETSRVARLPLRFSLCLIAVRIALAISTGDLEWRHALDHLLLIALIASLAWLAIAMLLIVEAMVLTRYRVDVADNRRARRLRTQVILARRIGVALIVVVALGSMMLTFPAIQALGAGLLASAGVISIVAGLAAQTSLVNVFAGIQLAFTDAIRVDDVVVVQKEWGRIEEITLTYVVVHIWDDRRLILPSTYFTTTPFENWTRRQSEVMGTVEFDLDWRAPVEAMRAELKKVLADTPLWDKRVGILQITDATAGFVRVRILVSAADSASLFDLRCLIREELVLFLQEDHPTALPHVRLERLPSAATASAASSASDAGTGPQRPGSQRPGTVSAADEHHRHADPHDSQLFTGSIEAIQRSKAFSGPGEDVFEDRDNAIASQN